MDPHLCSSCVFPYPGDYGPTRRAIAATSAAVTLLVIAAGLVLFWAKRRSFLVAKRDWWVTLLCTLFTVLALDTTYREYFGEAAMPCGVFFPISYAKASLIPSALVARVIGLYARHARQQLVMRTRAGGSPLLLRASTPAALKRLREGIDAWVLRHRLDSWRRQALIVLVWAIPWLVYYFARLATTPTFGAGYVGCRLDRVDKIVMFTEAAVAVALTAYPALSLRGLPDTVLLRYDLLAQVVCWVFGATWFAFATDDSLWVVHPTYGILGACLVTFVASVWTPVLASVACKHAIPSGLEGELVVAADGLTSPDALLPRRQARVVPSAGPDFGGITGDDGYDTTAAAARVVTSAAKDDAVVTVASLPSPIDEAGVTPSTERVGASPAMRGSEGTPLYHASGDPCVLAPPATSLPGFVSSRSCSSRVVLGPLIHASPQAEADAPLAGIFSTRLVAPPPDADELRELLLRVPAAAVLSDARGLRVMAAFLVSEARGTAVLAEALRLEFNAELLVFLHAAAALRAAAMGRRRAFASAFAGAVADFVNVGAPHEINLGAGLARSLATVAMELQLAGSRKSDCDGSNDSTRASLVLSSLRLLGAAEREVFRLLVSGPVFRLLQHPGRRAAAFEAMRATLEEGEALRSRDHLLP